MKSVPPDLVYSEISFAIPSVAPEDRDPRTYCASLVKDPESIRVHPIFEEAFRADGRKVEGWIRVTVREIQGPVILGHVADHRVDSAMLRRVFGLFAKLGPWMFQYPNGESEANLVFGRYVKNGSDFILYAEKEEKNGVEKLDLQARRPSHLEDELVRIVVCSYWRF